MEETAAWGTYEATATKEARFLGGRRPSVAVQHHVPQDHRRSAQDLSEATQITRRRHSTFQQPSEALRSRRNSSMACRRSIVGSLAGVDGSESMRDWCREMGIDDLDEEEGAEANQEMETPKLNLEPDIQLQMRRLFSVYFDEYHDHHDGSSSSRRHANLFSSINGTMSWVYGFVTKHMPMPKTCLFVESCLRGIGQVFFQNNPVSGLLIAIGLFVQSTRVAVHGILALVCGNGTAYLLGMDRGLVRSGLFGYNSYLVGLALATFGSSQSYGGYSVAVALATLVFSSFSSVVFVVLGKLLVPYKSPPLTLPFNFVVLTYLLATAHMANVTTGPVRSPELPDYAYVPNSEDTSITAKGFFSGVLRGVGQVFLADNLVAGALVLAGLAVCSRISALAALFGSLLGAAVAVGTGVPGNAVASGLYGFNSSLSCAAMLMFYSPSKGALVLGIMASMLTVFAQQALETLLEPFGLPVMTLPFCVITLPFIILQGTTTVVIAVPLQAMTVPEDHLQKVHFLEDGFSFLKAALDENETKTFGGRRTSTSSSTHSKLLSSSISRISSALRQGSKDFRKNFDKESTGEPAAPRSAMAPTPIRRFCQGCRCHRSLFKVTDSTPETASRIFSAISNSNSNGDGGLDVQSFQKALQASGLSDNIGLEFASLVFRMIVHKPTSTSSNTGRSYLNEQEFVVLALVTVVLVDLKEGIGRCFDFIDTDGNGDVTIDEINASLAYLGEPELSEGESRAFCLVASNSNINSGGYGCGSEGEAQAQEQEGVDITELINFVTVTKIRSLVSEYHENENH